MSTEDTVNESGLANQGEWDPSEELDQLQPEDTLEDRGIEDALDEGIVAREGWSPGQKFGNTAAEQAQGESLEQRLAQEVPEPDPYAAPDEVLDDGQVGTERAGRLVAPDEGAHGDDEQDEIAHDVGIDGAGASAEEAAMHIIEEN